VRIYLACTVRGNRDHLAVTRALARRLIELGHEVLTAHLLEDDVDAREASLDEQQVYARDLRWLTACDVLVAEASGSSYGVGFEVGYVLGQAGQTDQRVYVLYRADRRDAISRLIPGTSHPRCTTRAYTSTAELLAFIDEQFGPGRSHFFG